MGIGAFKRRCMEPFDCRNGRIVGSDVNFGCKCATDANTPSTCQHCDFRADEFGTHCTRCLGGTFLQADNRCHENCEGTGLITYAPGNCELFYAEIRNPLVVCTCGMPCDCNLFSSCDG